MAERDYYERRSKALFEDLHLEGDKEYLYPSGRKRKLEKAIQELDGKRIATMGVLKLRLEKTADGSDWKLLVHNTHRPLLPAAGQHPGGLSGRPFPNPSAMILCLGQDIGAAVGAYAANRRLYEMLATHYPADWIYQALSEYKAEGKKAKHPPRFFLSILHRLVHQHSQEWIKPCPLNCKYRSPTSMP